jgi:hypothetical protein
MFLMKVSTGSLLLSIAFFTASYLTSLRLPEAGQYSFPESIGRHYAAATGGSTEFGQMATFDEKIPIQNGSVQIREIEVETTSIKIEVETHEDPTVKTIDVSLQSKRAEKDRPVLVDTSRGQVLRLMTNELTNTNRRSSFMVFNFDDDKTRRPRSSLLIRIPQEVEILKVRTVSANLYISARPQQLQFQSKSGSLVLNPLKSDSSLRRTIGNLSVETVSGKLKGPGDFQALKFNSVSGDVKLTTWGTETESVSSQTISGDFEIDLPTTASLQTIDATITFDSKSGSLKVDDQTQKTKSLTMGKGRASVSVVSVSGNFEISVEDRESSSDSDNDSDG